jgi:hypothetical protein
MYILSLHFYDDVEQIKWFYSDDKIYQCLSEYKLW